MRQLEASAGATLDELLQFLPEDYPKNSRTIRRDLEALEAAGYLLVADNEELAGCILSFGSQVKVPRPDVLASKLKDEARKILKS